MAKIVITLTDKRGGSVNADVELDPPLKKGKKQTPAQNMLGVILHALEQHSEETRVLGVEGE